jgi:orotate phosphoribosyltransferase
VLIALDRMERGGNATEMTARSAAQEVEASFGIPVFAIATLDDIMAFLADSKDAALAAHRDAVAAYRERYGAPYGAPA